MTLPRPLRLLTLLSFGLLFAALQLSACSGTRRCSAENCDTCCTQTGECVLETSRFACGAQGAMCDACGSTQTCVSGSCRSVTGEDGGSGCQLSGKCTNSDGTCGADCQTGCCDSAGTCHPDGLADSACGHSARACVACSSTQVCTPLSVGGTCVAAESDVFKPCQADTDCASLPKGICKLTTTVGNTPYRGGYCTHLCGKTGDPICPGDAECVGGVEPYGEGDAFCWKKCATSQDCRGGSDYACYSVGSTSAACWLKPRAAPANLPGSACTMDDQCGAPPDFLPFCLQGSLPDGGASGFTGGSCAVDCDILGDEQCGPTGLCTPQREAGQIKLRCQQSCTNLFQGQGDATDGGCRQGYVCRGYVQNDGGLEPRGSCVPNCNAPGPGANGKVGCGTGLTCQASGHCCNANGCI